MTVWFVGLIVSLVFILLVVINAYLYLFVYVYFIGLVLLVGLDELSLVLRCGCVDLDLLA